MNNEAYLNGEHNGGVFNHFNLNSYGYCYGNPIRYIDPNGKQVDAIWMVKGEKDDVFISAGENMKSQPNTIQIIAHGNPRGFEYVKDNKTVGAWINTHKKFDNIMNSTSEEWKNRKKGDDLTVIIYSCRTGREDTKKYGESIVKKLSKEFTDVTFIAPNERGYFNCEGLVGSYTTTNTDENGDHKDPENPGGMSKEGKWNVFKGGKIIKSYDGDWTPKPKSETGFFDWLFHEE